MSAKVQANTREATLRFLLREGESSASSLSESLGISVQAMRKHLRGLEFQGLVQSSSLSAGPGRPSNRWQLTRKGKDLFNNGSGSEKFALELLDSLEDSLSSEMMSDFLSNQAIQKARRYKSFIGSGSLGFRLKKLVQLRNAEGYMAEVKPLKDESSSWMLNAFHCSIRNIAEQYPVVCDQELQLIRSLFEDCQVIRVKWSLESGHSCGYQITPNKKDD